MLEGWLETRATEMYDVGGMSLLQRTSNFTWCSFQSLVILNPVLLKLPFQVALSSCLINFSGRRQLVATVDYHLTNWCFRDFLVN